MPYRRHNNIPRRRESPLVEFLLLPIKLVDIPTRIFENALDKLNGGKERQRTRRMNQSAVELEQFSKRRERRRRY